MRLRVKFSKDGPLAYTSHLDLMRVWERALRRAGVPLAYSQGFNPRPKLQLAAALPLGFTSEAELLDVWLEKPMKGRGSVESFAKALTPVLPEGLELKEVRQVAPKGPAMQTQVTSAQYRVTVEWGGAAEQVEARIERVLAATELSYERRGRRRDLRPLIERLWLEGVSGGETVLGMQLAARPGATGRPEAVLEALGMDGVFARYHRRRLVCMAAG
jgi:radical SAM-linked protein